MVRARRAVMTGDGTRLIGVLARRARNTAILSVKGDLTQAIDGLLRMQPLDKVRRRAQR